MSGWSDASFVSARSLAHVQLLEAANPVKTDCATPVLLSSSDQEETQSVGTEREAALTGTLSTSSSCLPRSSNNERIDPWTSPHSSLPSSIFHRDSTDLAQDNTVVVIPTDGANVQNSTTDLGNTTPKFLSPPSVRCQ